MSSMQAPPSDGQLRARRDRDRDPDAADARAEALAEAIADADDHDGDFDADLDADLDDDVRIVTAEQRFLARRAEVDAARRDRRQRLALLVVCAIAAVALCGFAVVQSGYFDVHDVEVVGAHRVSNATVLRVAAIHRGQSMIGLDTDGAVHRLEQLPWVQHAHVERHWPNAVRIVVDEYAASAYLRLSPNEVVLLGIDGRVLAHTGTPPPGLVMVTGVRVVPEIGQLLYPPGVGGVAAALPPALRARLRSLDLGEDDARLMLTDHSIVVLGGLDQLRPKAQAALAVLQLHPGVCTVVDVTVPSAPAATGC
jgi:cell division protein FtsQ